MKVSTVFKKFGLWVLGCCALFSLEAQDGSFSAESFKRFYDGSLYMQKGILEKSGANAFIPPLTSSGPPPQKIGYVPFSFANGSNNPLISYENVHVVVKGLNPADNHACFVAFDGNGVGSCSDTSGSTVASQYTYKLSSFPQLGGIPYVYMPSITSARIYFSINYKLVLTVNGSPDYTISDPSPTDTSDPSYDYLYDKVEFNIQPNQCVINPTLVDFFCLPLPITVSANGGCNNLYAGMPPTQNREAIFTRYSSDVAALPVTASQMVWSDLLLTQTLPAKNLRILSTNTALNSAPPIFNTQYLLSSMYGANWRTEVWTNYYGTNTIYMDLSQAPGYGIYSGQVSGGTFTFAPQTGSGTNVALTLPTSSVPFFAGTGFTTSGSPDATALPIIEKFLSAGLESGVLPTPSSMVDPINNSFFQTREPYYQNNSNLPMNTGPWYDLYSKVLHSFAVYPYNFYTYAYDDVLGNDNTITSNNILLDPINITITIGDMTGTTP